ncbi:MAG: DivIVA domain-containing protein [bacterium]|nr:DivIVA domain-containing protein [bacterium]
MRISAEEVREVKFSVALRGYAADEVDAFLEVVTDTISEYEANRREHQEEIKWLRSTLDEYRPGGSEETDSGSEPKVQADEVVAQVRAMIEEAARVSEQMVEQVLEAGEHLLDQFRKVMESPPDHPES